METEDHPHALLVGLLVIRSAEERERRAVGPDRGLDHVRNEALVRGIVEVLELLPRVLRVPLQVEIRAVMDAFELLPAERVAELDVEGLGRVVGTLLGRVLAEAEELVVLREVAVPLTPCLPRVRRTS